MVMEVSLTGIASIDKIYYTWHPARLYSVYAYIINKQHSKLYHRLDKKEQANYPPLLVERTLSEEEAREYSRQQKAKIAKSLSTVKNKHG